MIFDSMNQYFDDKSSLFVPIGLGSLIKKPALLFLKLIELFGDQFMSQIIRVKCIKKNERTFQLSNV